MTVYFHCQTFESGKKQNLEPVFGDPRAVQLRRENPECGSPRLKEKGRGRKEEVKRKGLRERSLGDVDIITPRFTCEFSKIIMIKGSGSDNDRDVRDLSHDLQCSSQ